MSNTVDSDRPEPVSQADPQLHLAPSSALGQVTAASGTAHDPATLRRRLFHCQPPSPENPTEQIELVERLDWLARAAREIGLRTSIAASGATDIVAILEGGQPLITASDDGTRWYVAVQGRRGRIDLTTYEGGREESRSLRARDLASGIGKAPDEATHWLISDPATPQDRAVTKSGDAAMRPTERLAKLLAPERADIWAVVAFAMSIGLLSLSTPIAVQSIVNSVGLGGLLPQLVVVVSLLAVALTFVAILSGVQVWLVELIQRRLFIRTVADVAARLPRVKTAAYDDGHGPEIVNRFFDIVTIQKSLAKLLIDALGIVLSIIVGLGVLAFYHPILFAFDFFLIVAIGLIVFAPLKRGMKSAVKESTAKYAVAAWLEEIARSPQAFKTAGAEQWIFERSDELSRNWLGARAIHFRTVFGQVTGALTLLVVASTALLGIGGYLVMNDELTVGQLVAAELIVTAVVLGAAKMGKHLEHWYDMIAAVHKVGQLLDLPLEDADGEHPPRVNANGASIALDGVGMRDGRGKLIFSDCDVQIEAGQRLAISGPNGAGKTALLELLWGLREPSQGAIRIDGRDYRDLSPASVHEDVALVSSIEIVDGTIRENVRLHRAFVSNDDVRRALRATGLQDVVAELEDGLGTKIHPSTRKLSKSEKERLMLARALAGSPRVLVLDGVFDRLNPTDREQLLRSAVFDETAGRTIIIVTESDDVATECGMTLTLGSPATLTRRALTADVSAS